MYFQSSELAKTLPANFRTQLCANFATTGKCYHGKRCNFAHSDAEHIVNANTIHSRHFKTKICPMLSTGCPYGKNCNYAHNDTEKIINVRSNNNTAASITKIPNINVPAEPVEPANANAEPAPVPAELVDLSNVPAVPVEPANANAEPALVPAPAELVNLSTKTALIFDDAVPVAAFPSILSMPASAERMDFAPADEHLSTPIPLLTLTEAVMSKVPADALPSSIPSEDLITHALVGNSLNSFPPFSFALPVTVAPIPIQYKHSSHPQHALLRETSSFKCSICRRTNITQGRHKCVSPKCAWNACQTCMDKDFLISQRPVSVTNFVTPNAPVFDSSIVLDSSKPVPPSPFVASAAAKKRALSLSPQQIIGNPNTSSNINAPKAACLVQLGSPSNGADVDDRAIK